MAPSAENNQPIKLMLPKLASADGIKNTPAPIILPTTKDVLVQSPIFLGVECMFQDKQISEQKKTPRKREAFQY